MLITYHLLDSSYCGRLSLGNASVVVGSFFGLDALAHLPSHSSGLSLASLLAIYSVVYTRSFIRFVLSSASGI